MAKKIDDIFKDLNSYIDKIEDSIDERVAAGIAYTVRQRMLSLISKGISPILGWGRFPEYKNVKQLNSLRRNGKSLRALRKAGSGNQARIRRALSQNKRNQEKARKGYPLVFIGQRKILCSLTWVTFINFLQFQEGHF